MPWLHKIVTEQGYDSGMGEPINLHTTSDSDLELAIRSLKPAKTLYSGRAFLLKIFQELGREKLCDFLGRVNDMPEELDYDLHLTEEEKTIFRSVLVQFWDRRKFLNTFGWGGAGVVAMGLGTAGMAEQLECAVTKKPLLDKEPGSSLVSRTADFMHKVPGPPTEFLIGASLVQECHDEWNDIKLEEIGDAVEVLVHKLRGSKAFMKQAEAAEKGISGLGV